MPSRKALDREFETYILKHKADLPNESIGVGSSYDFQLFDRALLDSRDTRFVLAGIVNRMDRAYVREANCGEIRLIYRLTRIDAPPLSPPCIRVLSLRTKSPHRKAPSDGPAALAWPGAGDPGHL